MQNTLACARDDMVSCIQRHSPSTSVELAKSLYTGLNFIDRAGGGVLDLQSLYLLHVIIYPPDACVYSRQP